MRPFLVMSGLPGSGKTTLGVDTSAAVDVEIAVHRFREHRLHLDGGST